jgi:prepilin-type N-terminal cleavage/methylation domain-containing protein
MMRRGEAGFTLIESLVALTVFVGVVTAFYQTMGGSWHGIRRVQRDGQALALAKSKVNAAGLEQPLTDGQVFAGDDDGIRWQLSVERYGRAPGDEASTGPVAYWLRFQATWRDGSMRTPRSLELRTLKLEPAP